MCGHVFAEGQHCSGGAWEERKRGAAGEMDGKQVMGTGGDRGVK